MEEEYLERLEELAVREAALAAVEDDLGVREAQAADLELQVSELDDHIAEE